MKNLITIWSDVNHCEPAAHLMHERLEKLGMNSVACYNQRALPHLENSANIVLAIIFIDAPKDDGPAEVLKAISETVKFNKELPILLVKCGLPNGSRHEYGLKIHGAFWYNHPDEDLRTAIIQARNQNILCYQK